MDHRDMESNLAQMASIASNQITQQPVPQQLYEESPGGSANGNKRKADDSQQGPGGKSRRSRYISLACNECKRRKIKCNGQTPCQRCGNLNLECVYAPNCCNGFKDSSEYKEMAAHVTSLQDQVNILFENLNHLRATLGQPTMGQPTPSLSQQLQAHTEQQQQQQQQGTPIDPSLQSAHGSYPSHGFPTQHTEGGAPVASMSPTHARQRSQSQQQQQPSFRGPTSTDFSFGVAKSSLQTMGIHPQAEQVMDGSGEAGTGSGQLSAPASPDLSGFNPPNQGLHEDKDPIWSISKEEAQRLCRVYEDEMGLMYPILDIEKITVYTENLYNFMDAMRRQGLFRGDRPGADKIDDDDANILKMVIACALMTEGSGRSDLGQRIFDNVQPATDNLMSGNVGLKGIRLLAMRAMYEFHRDNESASWRLIGLTARLCIELGLHRRETYEAMKDETEKVEATLLFWAIYVLDRRWSFGTGMPFALQDADIDPLLPRPEDRSPYLSAMIKYCEIGSKVWRTVASTPSPATGNGAINVEDMGFLDYQIIQWHRQIPNVLKFDHPSQPSRVSTPIGPPPSRAGHRLRILLYLRANQMRIFIYRPVLHSATSIMQHREQAQTVVDVAKDSIRVLTHINQTSDLYRTQQVLFNAFLTSALAVLFLAVSHTPAVFAENVREEFYMALELVRGFSKGSFVSKRLWKTIRGLKEVAPRLGLSSSQQNQESGYASQPSPLARQTSNSQQQPQMKEESDPSRSAAVAMAGLAGHNVDELQIYNSNGGQQTWNLPAGASSSPEGMANDLTSLFEAAGGLQAMGQQGGIGSHAGHINVNSSPNGGVGGTDLGEFGGFGGVGQGVEDGGLSGILKELF